VDFIVQNWYLIAIAALSAGMLFFMSAPSFAGSKGSTVATAVQLMNRSKAVVIDIRDVESYELGHIFGARNIVLKELEERLPKVVKNKKLPVIFVCLSGSKANRAVAIAKKLGYDNPTLLVGGLNAWLKENMPTETK
jgi:rhodanese-related sulfurtransferase